MDNFIFDFYSLMQNVNLNALGILDGSDNIHTLGTDSKLIGRIFEMLTQPVLEKLAIKNKMIIETPKTQNTYPDFIFKNTLNSNSLIAVDVKTTYVNNSNSQIKFTLGSFGSYLRDNYKNIEYSYTQYVKHYVIGFVYKRNGLAQESKVYDYSKRFEIIPPYYDVEFFMQEKYKIVGEKPGSGNTENIGSFPTNDFDILASGKGPFSLLGPDICDMYWSHYPTYRSSKKAYTNLTEFVVWFLNQRPSNLSLIYHYDYQSMYDRILKFGKKRRIIA